MPKLRSADEIRELQRRVKSTVRTLNRQIRDEKVRDETLNWVMGANDTETVSEESADESPEEEAAE